MLSYIPQHEFERLLATEMAPLDKVALFAQCCRVNTLYMIQRAGSGHPGSSFSSMDVVCLLLLEHLQLKPEAADSDDIFFSSKGHDAPGWYAALLGKSLLPMEKLHALRRLGGLPGHPDHKIPYCYANTGSLGMGISKAKGMIQARRLQKRDSRVFVMTGDGELQEGQIWESLISAANDRLHELTVIVDKNDIQSDTWVADVSDTGDLAAKFAAFGWHVTECDGHDLPRLQQYFDGMGRIDKPKVLLARTIKGKGVSFMDFSAKPGALYPYHSGALDAPLYARALQELSESIGAMCAACGVAPPTMNSEAPGPKPAPGGESLIGVYARLLCDHGQRNNDLVVLSADLMVDCGLKAFKDTFPGRFFECGIAEQDMVSQASGWALQGYLPVVHSFACFLSARPNEHIYNNATERNKIIYVAPLAGLLPAGPGHSHQAVRDIAALASVPGLTLMEPASSGELEQLLDYAVAANGQSSYIRLCSLPFETYDPVDRVELEPGKGLLYREGDHLLMITYGPVMLHECMQAARRLAEDGHGQVAVMSLPWLNRVDETWLHEVTHGYETVICVDNHYVRQGQGEMIAACLGRLGYHGRVMNFGVEQIPECGSAAEILRYHGLDSASMASKMTNLLPGKQAGRSAQSAQRRQKHDHRYSTTTMEK